MGRIKIFPICVLLSVFPFPHPSAFAEPILFLSTQLTPLPEAAKMRDVILTDFQQSVDFEPYDRTVFDKRVIELASSSGGSVVLGGLQEDFLRLYNAGVLANMDDLLPKLAGRAFLPGTTARGKLGSETRYFIPWMQARHT